MNARIRVLRTGLIGLALLCDPARSAGAQNVTREETVRSVRRMLERLPYTACSTTSSFESTVAPSTSPASASTEG